MQVHYKRRHGQAFVYLRTVDQFLVVRGTLKWPFFSSPSIMRPMDSNAILTLAPFLFGNDRKHHAGSLQAMPWTSICIATYYGPISCGPWHTEMAIFFKPFHHETNGLRCNSDTCSILI